VVEVDDDGAIIAVLYGPLPEEYAQVSGCAEVYAFLQLVRHSAFPPLEVWTDYADLIAGLAFGVEHLRRKESSLALRIWEEVFAALRDGGDDWAPRKVKGHMRAVDAVTADLAFQRLGNGHADLWAKAGAAKHHISGALSDRCVQAQRDCREVGAAAGTVLAAWLDDKLPKDLPRRPRPGGATRGRPPLPRPDGHDWLHADVGWVCRTCGRRARTTRGLDAARRGVCVGRCLLRFPPSLFADKCHGHRLVASTQPDDMPLLWCTRCGCHGTTHTPGLALPCRKKAIATQRTVLNHMLKRRHPDARYRKWKHKVIGKPTRVPPGLADFLAAWCGDPVDAAKPMADDALPRPKVNLCGVTIKPFYVHGPSLGERQRDAAEEEEDEALARAAFAPRDLFDDDADDEALLRAQPGASPNVVAEPRLRIRAKSAPPVCYAAATARWAAGAAQPGERVDGGGRRPGIPWRVRALLDARRAVADDQRRFFDRGASNWR